MLTVLEQEVHNSVLPTFCSFKVDKVGETVTYLKLFSFTRFSDLSGISYYITDHADKTQVNEEQM